MKNSTPDDFGRITIHDPESVTSWMSDGKCRIHPRLSSFQVMAPEWSEPRPSAIDAQCRSSAYSTHSNFASNMESGAVPASVSAGGFYVGGK